MTPSFTMPPGEEAANAATVAELRYTIRALRCAVALLSHRARAAEDRAVVRAMRRAIRRAAEALRRLPSRWSL